MEESSYKLYERLVFLKRLDTMTVKQRLTFELENISMFHIINE